MFKSNLNKNGNILETKKLTLTLIQKAKIKGFDEFVTLTLPLINFSARHLISPTQPSSI